jgi:hypothetical protein
MEEDDDDDDDNNRTANICSAFSGEIYTLTGTRIPVEYTLNHQFWKLLRIFFMTGFQLISYNGYCKKYRKRQNSFT